MTPVEPERFQKVRELFDAALEHAPRERAAFLEQACGDDRKLREEVERLLGSRDQAGGFLEMPAGADVETVATTAEQPLYGSQLAGRYHIERELGHGGFGVVYLARDTRVVDKPVVVKVLSHKLDRTGWFHKKFQQECEALARIDHPAIIGVLDQGETPDGLPFLVMEYVHGVTLRAVMSQGQMPLERVASLVREIGQALDCAHEHGVFHRDLKPENIMIRDLRGGREMPVIIDFGVATVKDSRFSQGPLTGVAGSVPYMAPEQLAGHPEAASDTYALAVIAFEMIGGRRPFPEESPVQLYLRQQQGSRRRLRDLRPDAPEAAEPVLWKALSYEPKERYANATEFAGDLARALTGPAPLAPPPARTRLWALATVVLALAAAGAGVWWRLGRAPEPPRLSVDERTLHYYILVLKPEGEAPFRVPGEMLFPAGYRIRLMFSSPEPGFFYLINEAPVPRDGLPSYNVLFPSPAVRDAHLAAGQDIPIPSATGYFVFDKQQGEEKLWMVWAKHGVPELEAVKKWVNVKDRGTVGEPREVIAVRDFLAKHSGSPPRVETNQSAKLTILRGRGELLVNLLRLPHH